MDKLIWSDAIVAEAQAAHSYLARRLVAMGVPGDLVLTGGSSVPGLLTKGDIDLHLRVAEDDFAEVVRRLAAEFAKASPDAWADTLAVFDIPGARSTGLAVTPIGSEHDHRFTASWDRLRADAELRAEYNALKKMQPGETSYEARKSDFFTKIVSPNS